MFNEENTVEQMVLDTLCISMTSSVVADNLHMLTPIGSCHDS